MLFLLTAAMAPLGVCQEADVAQFGARGDGVTDDTEAIQRAVDAVGATGGTLRFGPGTYVVTAVGLRPGVRYLGYGATIKRPPGQGKWVRTFSPSKEGYIYSSDRDSEPLTIEGLTFDGNRAQQGEYRGYELEQAHLLFLAADPAARGRLRARIVNCHFQDCVADGISLYTNVEAQIVDCTARDCFRGGLTITGGNARVQVTNLMAYGAEEPTGIDVEIDGAGYGGSMKLDLTIDGLLLPDGDFDVAVGGGSTVVANNIIARAPFYLVAHEATVRISNSTFGVGAYSEYGNRIVFPEDVAFSNCRFMVDGESGQEPTRWAAAHVYWNVSGTNEREECLRFTDCDFTVGPDIAEQDTTYAVYCEADQAAWGNRLVLDGCRVTRDFDTGVHIQQGGTLTVRDTAIAAALPFYLGSSGDWALDALIDGVDLSGARAYATIPAVALGNCITHRDMVLDASLNTIHTQYGLAANRYRGGRTILGDAPPSAGTDGLLGDVFRLSAPRPGEPWEWVCTRTGCADDAEWRPITRVEP